MTSISLGGCGNISDIGVVAIARACHQLTSIILTDCTVSNISMTAIAQGCHQLTYIHIKECKGVSDRGVVAVAAGCHHLTTFVLDQQTVSDTAVLAIAKKSSRLACIHLNSCSGVSKDCIMTLLRSYPHMSILESNEYSRISEYNLENR